jgi:hypothetical protein
VMFLHEMEEFPIPGTNLHPARKYLLIGVHPRSN